MLFVDTFQGFNDIESLCRSTPSPALCILLTRKVDPNSLDNELSQHIRGAETLVAFKHNVKHDLLLQVLLLLVNNILSYSQKDLLMPFAFNYF